MTTPPSSPPLPLWPSDNPDLHCTTPTAAEWPRDLVEALPPADLRCLRERYVAIHRHEDLLFNSRLEALLIAASVMGAAYSQVNYGDVRPLRLFLAVSGLLVVAIMSFVLRRSARAIEWNIGVIRAIERRLQVGSGSPNLLRSTYDCRRVLRTEAHPDAAEAPPISVVLSVWLPSILTAFFLGLFFIAL